MKSRIPDAPVLKEDDGDESGERIIPTPLLVRTLRLTESVHRTYPLVVWSGPPGNGKTFAARYLRNEMETAHDAGGKRGIAKYFAAPQLPRERADRRMLKLVYRICAERPSATLSRDLEATDYADVILTVCENDAIHYLLIDEAGQLPSSALRGLCALRDRAEERRWRLSIVLIGMDDLPRKIRSSPQVKRRVHQWCYFQPYSFGDTWQFLAELHPHFAKLRQSRPADVEQVEYIYRTVAAAPGRTKKDMPGALPGKISPFLAQLDGQAADTGRPINLDLIQATHLMMSLEERRAFMDYEAGYVGIGELDESDDVRDDVPHRSAGSESTAGAKTEKAQSRSRKLKATTGSKASASAKTPRAARGRRAA